MQKKIVFMGTPEFAVQSLQQLLEDKIKVVAVVTAPDRPAGRGQKLRMSAVKEFALEAGIPVLQPENLKSPEFIEELESVNADLFVVVAFRMLPEVVWKMPELGTINLHGSLLPNYRGAAPINWAVINGESKTGATTFFIEKEIDTGAIIDQVKIDILPNDTAGAVHDNLMMAGAKLLSDTVHKIFNGEAKAISQDKIELDEVKSAPKIFKTDCKINWQQSAKDVHNKIRGLSPYPTAWTELKQNDQVKSLKLFFSKCTDQKVNSSHSIKTEGDRLYFAAKDYWVEIAELQLEGKKRMKAADFLKGYDVTSWELIKS